MMQEKPIRRTARQARGGDIILKARWQRLVFIGGLVAFVLFALIGSLVAIA
jgi:hypothetical protein